jgi:hypothetical protein
LRLLLDGAESSRPKTAGQHSKTEWERSVSGAYLDRIDRAIDRAGKKSDYTKLFRFDGVLPVDDWKSLCTDFFRGNDLLPEYFAGRDGAAPDKPVPGEGSSQPQSGINGAPGLGVLVSFDEPPNQNCIFVVAEEKITHEGDKLQCIELPNTAASREFLLSLVSVRYAHMIEHRDKVINFPRIVLGRRETIRADWHRVIKGLLTAIRADTEAGNMTMVSLAIGWQSGDVLTTVSIAGKPIRVADMLEAVETTVDPEADATAWIKSLKTLVKDQSHACDEVSDPTSVLSTEGILRVDHAPVVGTPPRLYVPTGVQQPTR